MSLSSKLHRAVDLLTPAGRLAYRIDHQVDVGGMPHVGVTAAAGKVLYGLAKNAPVKGDIVEIGSCYGRSTIFLAEGAKASQAGLVWAVDPHTGGITWEQEGQQRSTFDAFRKNLKTFDVGRHVRPLKTTSKEAAAQWDGRAIRLLFVDGWHSYEAVTEDILCWFPHLISGGVIVFDDYLNPQFPGVRRAIDEQMTPARVKLPLRTEAGLAWTTKH